MAEKIEGWVTSQRAKKLRGDEDKYSVYGDIFFFDEGSKYDVPVTMVVHDVSSRERVFTESEVRAMVSEMVEGVTAGEELTLETIASEHGVSLDPD